MKKIRTPDELQTQAKKNNITWVDFYNKCGHCGTKSGLKIEGDTITEVSCDANIGFGRKWNWKTLVDNYNFHVEWIAGKHRTLGYEKGHLSEETENNTKKIVEQWGFEE